jgi:hypothetical protein
MKIFFQILFVLCFPLVGMAQGNLQFNQAKFIEQTSTPYFANNSYVVSDSFSIVVPVGKTWKIESITTGQKSYDTNTQATLVYSVPTFISINDAVVFVRGDNHSYLPIWLPTGTYIVRIYGSTGSRCKTNISAIEFNITP